MSDLGSLQRNLCILFWSLCYFLFSKTCLPSISEWRLAYWKGGEGFAWGYPGAPTGNFPEGEGSQRQSLVPVGEGCSGTVGSRGRSTSGPCQPAQRGSLGNSGCPCECGLMLLGQQGSRPTRRSPQRTHLARANAHRTSRAHNWRELLTLGMMGKDGTDFSEAKT